jgi:hypothetical protein
MRAAVLCCFLYLVLSSLNANAGQLREIEMTDGSVITAEVLSLTGGIYTVRSDSLGTIRLEESKIRAIRTQPSGPQKNISGSVEGVRSVQEKMMSDKEIMSMIQSLKDDPAFKKALEDPSVMQAVEAGDVAALMANPQFMKLLNNATVQDIQKKVK